MDEERIEVTLSVSLEDGAKLPEYATDGSAALDIHAFLKESAILKPGERKLIPTGLKFAIPEGYEVQIRPRSGLALKHGVTLLNSPGTIDSDYRGDIGVILINLGQDDFVINNGDRIAQMLVAPVIHVAWNQVLVLDDTARGEGGFGHTGVKG